MEERMDKPAPAQAESSVPGHACSHTGHPPVPMHASPCTHTHAFTWAHSHRPVRSPWTPFQVPVEAVVRRLMVPLLAGCLGQGLPWTRSPERRSRPRPGVCVCTCSTCWPPILHRAVGPVPVPSLPALGVELQVTH